MEAIGMSLPSTPIVTVKTETNKGHDPEFWAEKATNRIVSVGSQSHPAIRDQAEAFKKQVYAVVLSCIKESIKSDRSTLAGLLGKNQQKDMADIIRRL
tara:strand:- start:747 stop:1040 length:294 start_codon:yes stop_codon:yes gene_type:complete